VRKEGAQDGDSRSALTGAGRGWRGVPGAGRAAPAGAAGALLPDARILRARSKRPGWGSSAATGSRISLYVIEQWCKQNPNTEIPGGLMLTQPWPGGPNSARRDQVIYYQFRADRARRTLRGIDEQIAKAERAVAGKVPVKRNRFITLTGGDKSVNRELETKARRWPGGRATSPTSRTRLASS
jgi:hypothetical protein